MGELGSFMGGISLPEKSPGAAGIIRQIYFGLPTPRYTRDGPVGADGGTNNHPPSLVEEGGRLSGSGFGGEQLWVEVVAVVEIIEVVEVAEVVVVVKVDEVVGVVEVVQIVEVVEAVGIGEV